MTDYGVPLMKSLWLHRTKLIGYVQVAMGAVAVMDQAMVKALIGENGLRWVIVGSGILTAIVGHYNSRKAK